MANIAPLKVDASRGEDRTYACIHQTSGTDTTVINITGWTIRVTIRDNKGTPVVTKTGTVTSGPSGTYTWGLTQADTLLLGSGTYGLDIWRTDSGSGTLMGLGVLALASDILY